jgi:hypothetical protein
MIDRRSDICKIIDLNIFKCNWTFGKKLGLYENIKKNYCMFLRLERGGFRIEHYWSKLEFRLLTKGQFVDQVRILEEEFLNDLRCMNHEH